MVGTARKCEICGDSFTYRSTSKIVISSIGMYFFLREFGLHVKACQAKVQSAAGGLNEAGLYYLGLQKKVIA